jgi:hypothetical protein
VRGRIGPHDPDRRVKLSMIVDSKKLVGETCPGPLTFDSLRTLRVNVCRSLINVDCQGILHSCDFNHVAGTPPVGASGKALTLDDMQEAIRSWRRIMVGQHCCSCTAVIGWSCTGVLP